MNRRVLCAVAAVFVVATLAVSQEVPRFTETTEVVIVNVDAVVVDRDGNHVAGLTADDFVVLENGVPQKITNFSEIQGTHVAAPPPVPGQDVAPATETARPRRVVFFIDNLSLHPGARKDVFESARHFFRTSVRKEDEVMVVTSGNGLKLRLGFTNDRARIEQTLNEIEGEVAQGALQQMGVTQLREDLLSVSNPHQALSIAREYAMRQKADVKQTTDSLKSMLAWLAGVEGKKAVVVLSETLPMEPGVEAFRFITSQTKGGRGATDGLEYGAQELIAQTATAANAANVALYPIYARGLSGMGEALAVRTLNPQRDHIPVDTPMERSLPGGGSASRKAKYESTIKQGKQPTLADALMLEETAQKSTRHAFNTLAFETGGVAITDSGDFAKAFRGISADLGNYYSLGYRPSTAIAPGAQRKFEVKPKNPAYTVRARRGFTHKTERERAIDQVTGSLFAVAAKNDLGITLHFGEKTADKKDRRKSIVPMQIRIPMDRLTLLPGDGGGKIATFDVHLRVSDERGGLSQTSDATREIKVPASDLGKIDGKYYTFNVDLLADNLKLRVAAGVTDVNSQVTSVAVQDLDLRK